MENTSLIPYDQDEPIQAYPSSTSYPMHYPRSDLICPLCKSDVIESKHHATKAGGTIGAIAGAGASIAGSFNGARIGASIGLIGGPIGATLGGVAGAVLGALAAGTAGCVTGITLGQIVDRTVLENHECLRCGHSFSQ